MNKNTFPDFPLFQSLFIPHSVKVLKKDESVLNKQAFDWFKKYFNPVFGSTTRCDTKEVVTYHWSAGLLIFGFPGLGDYYYKFLFKLIHFEKWKSKEWKEGFKYGRFCSKSKMKLRDDNYRDGNPYSETDFFRNSAWDAGYIMGLSNFSFKKWQAKTTQH